MGERLSAEDRESLCICADFAGLLDHDRVKRICKRRGEKAVERIVAAAVAEERERIARRMLNTVDPLLPGHEVRMACVEITRDES